MPTIEGTRRSARNIEAEGSMRTADNNVIPVSISSDPTRLAIWNLVRGDLIERGIDSPTFFFLTVRLVETLALLHTATESVKKDGLDFTDANGRSYPNPSFTAMVKLDTIFLKQSERLGLDPRSITFLARVQEASAAASEAEMDNNIDSSVVYLR